MSSKAWRSAHLKEILEYKNLWNKNNPEKVKQHYENRITKRLLYEAKKRAQLFGLPFTLLLEDIVIPKFCPVLGIPIAVGKGRQISGSPSLDRFIPELGYTKENIRIISWRANKLKSDSTVDELTKVLKYMKGDNDQSKEDAG